MEESTIHQPTFSLTRIIKIGEYKVTPYAALLLITFLVFLPTFSNGFQLEWDDTWQVLENPFVYEPTFQTILYHFGNFWQQQYSPVNTLFYAGIVSLYGFDASAFHTACWLVHVGSTFLVFDLTQQISRQLLSKESVDKIPFYAFFTALIFAIHPLQVESVAWISASKILLYGFFTLLALDFYIKYIKTSNWLWLIHTALFYALGFGSKEQAIILPLNLILVDFIFHRYKNIRRQEIVSYGALFEKTPFFLMSGAFWYFSVVNNLGNIGQEGGYPLYQRIAFGLYSLTEYIFRFLAPAKLYFFHPFPISPGEALPIYYWCYALLVGIIAFYIWENFKKGNRIVLYGFLFFLINNLLVLHLIPLPRTVITADRYMYISIIGLSWILIWQVDQWVSISKIKLPIGIVCMIWLLFLGVHSYIRTKDWKDSSSAKASVLEILEKRQDEKSESPFNLIEHE